MKKLFYIVLVLFTGIVQGQEWHSFGADESFNFNNLTEINIDKQSNNVVVVGPSMLIFIQPDGSITSIATSTESDFLPGYGSEDYEHAYFHNDVIYNVSGSYGLHKITFNPYKDTVIYNENIKNILTEADTIWVSGNGLANARKIINESINQPFTMLADYLIKYKGNVFGRYKNTTAGGILYHNGTEFIKFNEANSNILSDHVGGFCHNNENGILFVGTKEGLSQFNGVNFTNITPITNPEMPYKTVIDMAYDNKNGKLWMILGDTNWTAKTLTTYNGSWESYDESNTPIDFDEFRDMNVDTLGQIWIAERDKIHVFSTGELDGWLGVNDIKQNQLQVSVFPNPSNDEFNIEFHSQNSPITLEVINYLGEIIYVKNNLPTNQLIKERVNLSNQARGVYFINIKSNSSITSKKILKL